MEICVPTLDEDGRAGNWRSSNNNNNNNNTNTNNANNTDDNNNNNNNDNNTINSMVWRCREFLSGS